MGRSCFQRNLPDSHECLVIGQDCANLGRVPFARRPTGTGHQPPARPVRRLAQSNLTPTTGPIYHGADRRVVRPGVSVPGDDGGVGDWPSLVQRACSPAHWSRLG